MNSQLWLAALLAAGAAVPGSAQEAPPPPLDAAAAAPGGDAAALALKLSNPVASLISVPFQFNFDGEVGPRVGGDRVGERITLNIQPVIPIPVSADWNLISRTILPVVWQDHIVPGAGSQFGLGDTVQSLFLSPAQPKGLIWGVGPVFLVPTGTDDLLSGKKWGAGPTGVALKQMGPWTVGALANHIWSFAGSDARSDISATFVNPFVSHTSKTAFTYGAALDVTYDWKNDRWTVPVSINVSQVTKLGSQLVSIGGAARYYVATNDAAPHGFAGRFVVTLLFPTK